MSSLPAEDVHVRAGDGGGRELRFTTALANTGAGPLIVAPGDGAGCPAGQRYAGQRVVVDADGNGRYDPAADTITKPAPGGCMLDHPSHGHWHFDASASYALTRPGVPAPVAATDKVSFCLRDSRQLPGPRWSGATEHYDACERDSVQGITVGFADVYDTETPGQALPLDGVPAGVYCLTSTADPARLLREANERDNAATVALRITNTQAAGAPPAACDPPP